MKSSRIPRDIRENGRRFIESVAKNPEARDHYGPLPARSKGNVRAAILFGILTATESYKAAERALDLVEEQIETVGAADIYDWLVLNFRKAGIVYSITKATYVAEFLARFERNPTPFHPQLEETCAEYRDRLESLNIRGLGWVKVSFAAYLAYGGGNVICTDRHIINLYTQGEFDDKYFKRTKWARAALKEIEDHFVQLAAIYAWPSASALQWAVWSEALGESVTHDAVSNKAPAGA